jgi:hypothetical protein
VRPHGHNLRNNGIVGPFDAKDLRELLEVMCCCLADREYSIAQPSHAKRGELFIKKFDAQLARQERNVLDYG